MKPLKYENRTVATFYVVSGRSGSLISAETAAALGLIKFANMITTKSPILQQYPDVFNGIGKLKGVQVQLHIDENIDPVAQPYRRIPLPMRGKVEKEIKRLEDADDIEKNVWSNGMDIADRSPTET